MSTRCRIGIENNDGTITSIYCHNDGYPEGVGSVLVYNYKTEDKIRKLLSLGDMSSLGTEPIDNPHAWDSFSSGSDFMSTWELLNQEDKCNTYKSRGEDCPAITHNDLDTYIKDTIDGCDYGYLFKDGQWYMFDYDNNELSLVKYNI